MHTMVLVCSFFSADYFLICTSLSPLRACAYGQAESKAGIHRTLSMAETVSELGK